ncbi:hypothetical protein ACWGH5_15120 [Streptomyces sp. NPDC054864]
MRIDAREKAAEEAGAARADELWRPAHFCSGCSSVFCPDGTPWQGVLTTEQFKKFVWTQAGYADQLQSDAVNQPGMRSGTSRDKLFVCTEGPEGEELPDCGTAGLRGTPYGRMWRLLKFAASVAARFAALT